MTGCICFITTLELVLLGPPSVSTAVSLDIVLTGQYARGFGSVALLFLALGLVVYFRRSDIGAFDRARRQHSRIINGALLTPKFAAGGYSFSPVGVSQCLGLYGRFPLERVS